MEGGHLSADLAEVRAESGTPRDTNLCTLQLTEEHCGPSTHPHQEKAQDIQ